MAYISIPGDIYTPLIQCCFIHFEMKDLFGINGKNLQEHKLG